MLATGQKANSGTHPLEQQNNHKAEHHTRRLGLEWKGLRAQSVVKAEAEAKEYSSKN